MKEFNNPNVNLRALRKYAMYILEASGFEVVRREMPTIIISNEMGNTCYCWINNTIYLLEEHANADPLTLNCVLVHELTHGLQPVSLLNDQTLVYKLQPQEQQAYFVQRMFELGVNAERFHLGKIWRFMERYGNRKWFKGEFTKTCIMMLNNESIVNHKCLNEKLYDILEQA